MDKREFAQQVDAIKQQLFRMAYLYLNNEASALEAVDESVYKADTDFNQRMQKRAETAESFQPDGLFTC